MTKLLDKAIAKVRKLPLEEQERARSAAAATEAPGETDEGREPGERG